MDSDRLTDTKGMSAERLQEIRDAREASRAAEADGRYTGRNREAVERWAAMKDAAVNALLAEVERLRGVLDGMTDEWAYQCDDLWGESRTRKEAEMVVAKLSGAHVLHRRVTEWQEVQP